MAGLTKREVLPPWVRTVVIGRQPKWTLIRIITLVVLVALLYVFVMVPVRIRGISMEPNFRNGSVNLVYRLAYAWSRPKRGDVVCVRYIGNEMHLMKRIVALPGETIAFSDGKILINGQPLNEPYLKYNCNWDMPPRTLSNDEYFIVGDNRSMEFGSHTKGAYHITDMVGRVMFGGTAEPFLSTN